MANANKAIAIKWAIQMVNTNKPVMSDEFFAPFSKKVRANIISELKQKHNVLAWTMQKNGAFLCKLSDSRLKMVSDATLEAGVWVDEDSATVIMLPPREQFASFGALAK